MTTVLDGDRQGLVAACEMIAAAPHPDHLHEYAAVTGRTPGIECMLVSSVRNAEITAYAITGADALVGGISSDGLVRREIWFLATATAKQRRKWLLREARRMLRLADAYFGKLTWYGQVIPFWYAEGLNFARHLGFRAVEARIGPQGDCLVVVERSSLWARTR